VEHTWLSIRRDAGIENRKRRIQKTRTSKTGYCLTGENGFERGELSSFCKPILFAGNVDGNVKDDEDANGESKKGKRSEKEMRQGV
jgi:hypothetical protein